MKNRLKGTRKWRLVDKSCLSLTANRPWLIPLNWKVLVTTAWPRTSSRLGTKSKVIFKLKFTSFGEIQLVSAWMKQIKPTTSNFETSVRKDASIFACMCTLYVESQALAAFIDDRRLWCGIFQTVNSCPNLSATSQPRPQCLHFWLLAQSSGVEIGTYFVKYLRASSVKLCRRRLVTWRSEAVKWLFNC